MSKLICEQCNEPMNWLSAEGEMSTLVGFVSINGHHHDDNCLTRYYQCKNNHHKLVSIIRTCNIPDCDWVGASECFCHTDPKLNQWPD